MTPNSGLELWGGVECSIVRVGDEVRDQMPNSAMMGGSTIST